MQNSTSTSGRRLAAAMFLGVTSAAMVAGTAHADGGGVTGAKYSEAEDAGHVAMLGPTNTTERVDTALIGLKTPEGNELWTYCIQQTVALDKTELYDEKDWSSQTQLGIDQKHLEAIKWILNNSFPQQTDLAALTKSAGVTGGDLNATEAVEGTQAAIWTFSDASGKTKLDETKESDTKVQKLYTWLVQQATGHMGDVDQPKASLTLSPADVSGVAAGSKQAFKLMSSEATESFISVALSGPDKDAAKLVDANGKAIAANAKFKSGDTVYVQLPNAASKGGVTLTASGTVNGIEAGRVFVDQDGKPSQNLILAQALNAPVSASSTIKWIAPVVPSSSPSTSPSSTPSTPSTTPSSTPSSTPSTPAASTTSSAPGPSLAHTGAGNTVELAGGALALVAVGGGLVVYTRRNKKQSTGTHS